MNETAIDFDAQHERICELVQAGLYPDATTAIAGLDDAELTPQQKAQLANDRGVIGAIVDTFSDAESWFREAIALDSDCRIAVENLRMLTDHIEAVEVDRPNRGQTRVAILSLLFNWPSTGGGTVHTKELAENLSNVGFDVQHIYAVNHSFSVGNVTEPLRVPTVPLYFSEADWNAETIQSRFRDAVDQFRPDFVIVTDSWNSKVLLAEAVQDYKYFIRIAALENICPLNNVRLLIDAGQPVQCTRNQFDDPDGCRQCVQSNSHLSGGLHAAERALAGFQGESYPARLKKAFAGAEGILVVNPQIAEVLQPHAENIHVIPSGFDAERFPKPIVPRHRPKDAKKRILFAGLTSEYMKGYHVLHAAAERLWTERQDFELVATGDPAGRQDAWTRFIGWQSQQELPQAIADCDILAFPTLAQEALGRTAVEAMACGRPVVASDIGGLSFVVTHKETGLHVPHGDPAALAAALSRLLNDEQLRIRLGRNGRERFEQRFTWEAIVPEYTRLMGVPNAAIANA